MTFTAYFSNADTIIVHDTTLVPVHDTTFVPYPVHDTTIVHDTTLVPYPVHDTIYITIHDTIPITVHDTIIQHPNYYELSVVSGNVQRGVVAGNGRFPDSTYVEIAAIPIQGNVFIQWQDGNTDNPRTVQLLGGNASLVAIFDEGTQSVHDVSVLSSAVITANSGQILVSNAANQRIRIFDNLGRLISTTLNAEETSVFNMPASGVYLVQVGNAPAQRVVVVK